MNVHSIDIEYMHQPDELVRFFKDNKVKEGDTLKIITEEDKSALMIMGLIIIIMLALVLFFDSGKTTANRRSLRRKNNDDGEPILDDLFKGKSVEEIEKEVETEYGIKIEVEYKEDNEQKTWRDLSAQHFLKAYSDDEPEYTMNDIKEPNPLYQSKWKGK